MNLVGIFVGGKVRDDFDSLGVNVPSVGSDKSP